MQERRAVAALTTAGSPTLAGESGAGRFAIIAAVAAAALALDQLTKAWALNALDDGPIHVVGSLRFALSFNSGATFGIGRGLTPFVVAAAAVLVIVLIGVGRATTGWLGLIAIGMVTGGALGNLTDRLVRDHHGSVIDFIDLQWWPVFNLADAAIVIGSGLLLLAARRAEVRERA